MRSARWLLGAVVLTALFVSGCEKAPPPGCRTIAEIEAAGGMPIEVVSLQPLQTKDGRGFRLLLRNVSDAPVLGFTATAVLTAPEGGRRRLSRQELDYTYLPKPLPPAGEVEVSWRPKDPDADRGHVLLKDARYQGMPASGGRRTFKIQNARYETEFAGIQ